MSDKDEMFHERGTKRAERPISIWEGMGSIPITELATSCTDTEPYNCLFNC